MEEEKKTIEEQSEAETNPEESQTEGNETTETFTDKKQAKKLAAEEALKKLEDRVIEPPKKKKFGWLGSVFLLAVIALGIYLMLRIIWDMGMEVKSFGELIRSSDWRFALITLAVLLTILVCDCMKYAVIMKTTTGKLNLRSSVKVAFLGKFYDNVTPFAAGGQPMQIYYLHKKGFSGGVSGAVVMIKYFAQMFCWTLVSLLLMACNTGVLANLGDGAWETLIMVGAWIGLFINMLLPLMIVLFALLPKFARAIVYFFVNIGHKIKIVKDKEKTMASAEKVVADFHAGFVIMSRKPLQFIALLLLCLVDVVLTFAFPYFIMRTFSALSSESGFTVMLSVMALNVYAAQSVTVIPTPGNAGAMEGVVTKAFSAIAASALFWVVFTWRFAVYYIYIIIGIGLTVFEFIRGIVRKCRQKREEKDAPPSE